MKSGILSIFVDYMKQRTLRKEYSFEGQGLHTGKYARMTLCPADPDTGIVFVRSDIAGSPGIAAVAENVSSTARSTTLTRGGISVRTVEHILSALTGLGVDNAIVKVDSEEIPILDGSARFYAESISPDGTVEQDAERKWLEIKEEINIVDGKTGSYVKISPSDKFEFNVTIDFDSRVLGVQTVHWDESVDYASQVAPCRTFCFFHEIMKLISLGLAKGGNVQNAIIIVEKPVSKCRLRLASRRFRQPMLNVTPQGYLSNLELRFPDECGRHKLLDIMGDLRLAGGFLKANVTAYKPGHRINTLTAKSIREKTK